MNAIAATAADLSGIRKAAVMILQLSKEDSAKILSQLRENEVEEIMAEVARLGSVDADTASGVLEEFQLMAASHKIATQGGIDNAREMLEATLGKEKAAAILDRLAMAVTDMPFKFINQADPRQVLSFIQHEHPQTIALVLAHVTATMASQILSGLVPDLQADVAHRIAVMDRTSPEIIRQVESSLEKKISSVLQPSELSTVGGLQPLVDIINRADRGTERLILEALEARSPEIAEEIRRRMFMFEDIVLLEDRAIQLVLRAVETNDLAIALKGVNDEVRDKVTRNLSERGRENLMEEIELLGPVRMRQVEESQTKIVQAIRSLEESGQIEINRGGDDDEFVA